MDDSDKSIVLLKIILDNLGHPENLNNHPWVDSPFVKETLRQMPEMEKLEGGVQLVASTIRLFRLTMPNASPRRGLRLDTLWGEFGILAANYFVPLEFHLPFPGSLKEAWKNIDRSILLYVFGDDENISEEDRLRYQLIGNEPEVAPNSTISDWHRKGIERFSKFIERYQKQFEIKSKIDQSSRNKEKSFEIFKNISAAIFAIAILLSCLLIALGAIKGWGLYRRAMTVKQTAEEILVFYQSKPKLEEISAISPKISFLRTELEFLQEESKLVLASTKHLGWIPVYGSDIAQGPVLVDMIVQLGVTGDEVLKAVLPLLPFEEEANNSNTLLQLLNKLKDADGELLAAQVAFANAQAARQKLQIEALSPFSKNLIIGQIDPLLFSIDTAFPITDLLEMAQLAPRLMGAVGNGPQEYLILIQNEDELRPTGGFLTAAGLLTVENGRIVELSFESSDMVDDFNKPYPQSPWQLDDYMMAEILLFRDSNWFTNFPTTVEWAEFLYGYTGAKKIDGVISIDQRVIKELLHIVGPIAIVGHDELISSDNVMAYMRTAKENEPPLGVSVREWDRKQFISWLADPLVNQLLTLESDNWKLLSQGLIQLLDEKHILLQFDDPEMRSLIAKRGWDGTVKANPNSDFLLMVDSNVGFNKTNALMQNGIDYSIDLANPDSPIGDLNFTFVNNSTINADSNPECIQAGGDIRDIPLDEREYIMNDCYWTYFRVYTPAGTDLIFSAPIEIPEQWPLREQVIPAKTDVLDEDIPGVKIFGNLFVVPIGEVFQAEYTYQLPAAVVVSDPDSGAYLYRLKIQKQPGTDAIPMTIHLILPDGMSVTEGPADLVRANPDSNEWVLQAKLNMDAEIEVHFAASSR